MKSRSMLASLGMALTAVLVTGLALTGGAVAKGTPSNVSVTCDGNTKKATVTVQLMSGVTSPTPASNQIVLSCGATAKIQPLTQPAAAYAWSAFVTATVGTFGCGGTTERGTEGVCTNAAGGVGAVTVLAS